MGRIFLTIILILNLTGCAGVIVAGAAAGGVVINDQRSIETIAQDQNIAHQAMLELTYDKELNENAHIVVSSFNRTLLLVGQAPNMTLKQKATHIAERIPKVKKIYNEITLTGPISPLTESSDAWLTTKVKTKLLAATGLKSTVIKVVTENGTVYLMGLVTHNEATRAVNIARETAGVQRVVKIFEYT